MSTGPLMPFVRAQWLSSTGVPLAGYTLFTYLSGTDTPTDTFTTSAISTPNAWPVVLDSAGRATVYLDPEVTYKFVMADPTSTAITGPLGVVWTNDGVPGLVDPFSPPVTFEIDAIGSTPTDAAIFINATSAANNAQQWSPRIRFTGQGWNATAAASRVVDATEEAVPIQQASGDPVVALTFSTQVNGGGYTPRLAVRSDGAVAIAPTGLFAFSSSGVTTIDTAISRSAARKLIFDTGAGANGFLLDFSTDNAVKFRNRADSDNADLTAKAGTFSGALAVATTAFTASTTGALSAAGANAGLTLASITGAGATWTTYNDAAVFSLYGGGAVPQLTLSTGADVTIGISTGFLAWVGASKLTNTANGSIKFSNNSASAGVILKFSTDATLQVLDRSAADNAEIKALNITATGGLSAASYVVGGVNGVDFSGVVTSITVVKGIVTSAS